jgi:hypothetical protein
MLLNKINDTLEKVNVEKLLPEKFGNGFDFREIVNFIFQLLV